MKNYDFHKFANVFPLITKPEQKEALKCSIKKHGLLEPIVLYDGKILDGRNRYLACKDANIELSDENFTEFTGDDPLSYVIELNLQRRHIKESQRAMIAANITSMKRGDNQHASNDATSQDQAATMLNISRSAVQRAVKVKEKGIPELVEAVAQGKISVSKAANISKLPDQDQAEHLNGKVQKEECIPQEYILAAYDVMGEIDLDPASSESTNKTVQAHEIFVQTRNDGLKQDWNGRIWLNLTDKKTPSQKYAAKMLREFECGHCTQAVVLSKNNLGMSWQQDFAKKSNMICIQTRDKTPHQDNSPAPDETDYVIFYFGENEEEFSCRFADYGLIVSPIPPAAMENEVSENDIKDDKKNGTK